MDIANDGPRSKSAPSRKRRSVPASTPRVEPDVPPGGLASISLSAFGNADSAIRMVNSEETATLASQLLSTTASECLAFLPGFDDELSELWLAVLQMVAARQIQVTAGLTASPDGKPSGYLPGNLIRAGIKVIIRPTNLSPMIVSDRRYCLLWPRLADGAALFTDSPEFAAALSSLVTAQLREESQNGEALSMPLALDLTPEDLQMLRQAIQGLTDEAGARRMDTSERTYGRDMDELMKYLDATGRAHLGYIAREIVRPEPGYMSRDPKQMTLTNRAQIRRVRRQKGS